MEGYQGHRVPLSDPIRLVRMVNQILRRSWPSDLLHHPREGAVVLQEPPKTNQKNRASDRCERSRRWLSWVVSLTPCFFGRGISRRWKVMERV